MIGIIAWRNIWRNKLRSLIVILSIVVGLWAGIFIMSFSWGMYQDNIDTAISTRLSHIQLHEKEFKESNDLEFTIPNGSQVLNAVNDIDGVKSVTGRLLVSAMVSSTKAASGVTMYGIYPERESKITKLDAQIEEGSYFEGGKRNPILIGRKLAEKLGVEVRNKIVLTFQGADGVMTAGAFRVTGIYDVTSSAIEETQVYVDINDLNKLIGDNEGMNEIAVLLHQNEMLDTVYEQLKNDYPNLLVETWMDLSPELELVIDSFNEYMYIFMAIILLALAFGILNTMLMAVLERVRELGMLMAIGLNKTRLFMMIMLETIYLALVGGPVGVLVAWLTTEYFGKNGIDLSIVSQGLEAYGYSTMVYPDLQTRYYFEVALMTVAIAILSAIYPAIKALRLRPAVAIRKI